MTRDQMEDWACEVGIVAGSNGVVSFAAQPPVGGHTIVSAKHLKSINWRRGALAPYTVVSCFVEPNCRLPTTVDSSGGTKPVWNKQFALSISVCRPLPISFLTFDIIHSDDDIHPSSSSISVEFSLVVGSARLPLDDAVLILPASLRYAAPLAPDKGVSIGCEVGANLGCTSTGSRVA
ncbi:hypothetical protein EJ110_NYTH41391 [Nymphaea thermarum]|nr:hypothetical protein EJ110_NYTH41391 [Nymphaea thermarum]